MKYCELCHRPFNEGNSPNVEECTEYGDHACEAFAAGEKAGRMAVASTILSMVHYDGKQYIDHYGNEKAYKDAMVILWRLKNLEDDGR